MAQKLNPSIVGENSGEGAYRKKERKSDLLEDCLVSF